MNVANRFVSRFFHFLKVIIFYIYINIMLQRREINDRIDGIIQLRALKISIGVHSIENKVNELFLYFGNIKYNSI